MTSASSARSRARSRRRRARCRSGRCRRRSSGSRTSRRRPAGPRRPAPGATSAAPHACRGGPGVPTWAGAYHVPACDPGAYHGLGLQTSSAGILGEVAAQHVGRAVGWTVGCLSALLLGVMFGPRWIAVGLVIAVLGTLWLVLWLPRSAHRAFATARFDRAARRYRILAGLAFRALANAPRFCRAPVATWPRGGSSEPRPRSPRSIPPSRDLGARGVAQQPRVRGARCGP